VKHKTTEAVDGTANQTVRLDWGAKDGVKSMRIGFTYQRLTAHGGLAVLTRFITERGLREQLRTVLPHKPTSPNRTCSCRERGNCIGVLVIAHLSKEYVPPVATFRRGHSEFEGGLARRVAEDGRAGKQTPAQGGECGPLRLVESALQTDAQVVGAVGKMTGCFCRPKRAATQSLQAKLSTAIRPLNLSKFGTVDSRSLYFLARRKPHSAIPLSPRRIRPSLP
jgi:hypothetical protein